MEPRQQKILKNLIMFNQNLRDLADELEGVHEVEDKIVLTANQLQEILKRYLSNDLDKEKLCQWAELVEGRDGIKYEIGKEEKIADVLFWVTEHELNEPISKHSIGKYIRHLDS